MTNANVSNHPQENRGKIGPWEPLELIEMVSALHEVGGAVGQLLDGNEHDEERIELVRGALIELTKALAGCVSAGDPSVRGDLASAFYFITRSIDSSPKSDAPPSQRPPSIVVSQITSESMEIEPGRHVDVALLALAFYEPGVTGSAHEYTDALLLRRDRRTGERRFKYFHHEAEGFNFHRATEARLHWLHKAESPFVVSAPSSSVECADRNDDPGLTKPCT